jgi:hypothetical protein
MIMWFAENLGVLNEKRCNLYYSMIMLTCYTTHVIRHMLYDTCYTTSAVYSYLFAIAGLVSRRWRLFYVSIIVFD